MTENLQAPISQTQEAQSARGGLETLAWQTGKTATAVESDLRRAMSLAERFRLRRDVVERASPTVTEIAAHIFEKIGEGLIKAGERAQEKGKKSLERADRWAQKKLMSQQIEDEKALDEKARLSREAQIKATAESEVDQRVKTETTIRGREIGIIEMARHLKEKFMGWRSRVNTVSGQRLIMRGVNLENVGRVLTELPDRLREGWRRRKKEIGGEIDSQLTPLEESLNAGERIKHSLEEAFTRVVEGGPSAVQTARDVIKSLSPEDVQGQEETLREMIEYLAGLAGAGQQPESPLEAGKKIT